MNPTGEKKVASSFEDCWVQDLSSDTKKTKMSSSSICSNGDMQATNGVLAHVPITVGLIVPEVYRVVISLVPEYITRMDIQSCCTSLPIDL